jgi:glutathione synthase/RimK-type ligase-like ATP-grasp enzyme
VEFSEILSKYNKHLILSEVDEIKGFLPDTVWFGKKKLKTMLKKYKVVYVKPSRGTGGRGIFQVERKKQKGKWVYILHYRKKEKIYTDYLSIFKALRKKIKVFKKSRKEEQGRYLVQQGVQLLKYKNSLFDIRSYVQWNPEEGIFECNGVLVRVGHPDKIVTNISNSGKAMDFHSILSTYASEEDTKKLRDGLEELSLKIASTLREQCQEVVEVGLDFGYDHALKPWLIEVNLRPRYKGFKKISPDVYKKIHQRSKMLRRIRV